METKVISLATTYKCSACKCQKYLLEKLIEKHQDVSLSITDYSLLPEWLQTQIKLTDFPVTIFCKNGIVKYHFVGTKSIKKMEDIIKDIDF